MPATNERLVKKKVRAVLDAYGAYYCSPVGSAYGHSGVPDLIACYKGRFIGIECKVGSNKPTALQLKHLQAIIVKGTGISLVINEQNIDELVVVLDNIK